MASSQSNFFPCPTCGKKLPIVLERYPKAGGTFPCPGCKAPLTLPPLETYLATLSPPEKLPHREILFGEPENDPAESIVSFMDDIPAPRPSAAPRAESPVHASTAGGAKPEAEKVYRLYLGKVGTAEMTRMELWQAIRRGEIDGTTEVALPGSDDWKPITAYPELARLLTQLAHAAPAHSVKSQLRENAPLGRRLLAKLVDGVLVMLVMAPVSKSLDTRYTKPIQALAAEMSSIANSAALPAAPQQQEQVFPGRGGVPSMPPPGFESKEQRERRRADAAWQQTQQQQQAQQQMENAQQEARRQAKLKQRADEISAQLFDLWKKMLVASLTMNLLTVFLFVMLPLGLTGASPGKMLLGLRVRRPDGTAIGFGRAVGRTLAENLSGCLLLIGYLMAVFDDERRTLHDRLADTRVEMK